MASPIAVAATPTVKFARFTWRFMSGTSPVTSMKLSQPVSVNVLIFSPSFSWKIQSGSWVMGLLIQQAAREMGMLARK